MRREGAWGGIGGARVHGGRLAAHRGGGYQLLVGARLHRDAVGEHLPLGGVAEQRPRALAQPRVRREEQRAALRVELAAVLVDRLELLQHDLAAEQVESLRGRGGLGGYT
eukprot:2403209-Prymnesium_polylepis.1